MGILKKIINYILSFFSKPKVEPIVTKGELIKTSREDSRRYRRYCKRQGFDTLSGLPDYVTPQVYRFLKRVGVIK